MKVIFSAILFISITILSISLLPPPLTSDARGVTSVTISTIRNSCIVNNANIAVQNENITPLDAMNNWWGMPTGASDENRAGGDLIGTNILSQPHLVAIPPNCDLSDANWIPFNEQELQFAIQSNLPYLNGLDFALLDIVKGQGAKFTLVAKPMFGGASGEALITITPAPDGSFIRIMLDVSQLPADPNLSKIATCELMPLFMNSLQHVQNKFTNPSQLLEQLVVMDSALMVLFSPPTEITPEPAPEIVMNYDASCLPNLNENSENLVESGEGESLNLVTIPPLEGELELSVITPVENNVMLLQATDLSWGTLIPCNPGDQGWCAMLQVGDVITYTDYSNVNAPEHISINRTNQGLIEFRHELPDFITTPLEPSWGKVDNPENPNHYRLAFLCGVNLAGTQYHNIPCYWDSNARDYFYHLTTSGSAQISPDGLKIAYTVSNLLYIWDLQNNTHSAPVNSPFGDIYGIRWSDANTLYYVAVSSFSFNSPKLMYRLNLSVNPPITENINLDIPSPRNLQPYIFDVSSGNVLYWTYDLYTIPANRYGLNYFPPSSFITYSSGGYPIYWSPRLDGQAILIDYEFNPVTNQTDICIHISNYASLPTAPRVDCRQMGLGYLDWAGNIDLSAFIPPPTTGDCPDPSSLPSGSVDYYIAELCQYGITAFPNGLPTVPIIIDGAGEMEWHSTQYTYNNPWQASHLEDILAGVEKTALAFDMLANEINPTNTEDAKTLFRRIMGKFYVLNVDNGFEIYSGDGCNGTASSSCTSNTMGAVTFYSMTPNQYTMVHEIGHRFNARSNKYDNGTPENPSIPGITQGSLYYRMANATVCEGIESYDRERTNWCPIPVLIFGIGQNQVPDAQVARNNGWSNALIDLGGGFYSIIEWRRGERGWGSGPASNLNSATGQVDTLTITNFQQHSFMINDWVTPLNPNPEDIFQVERAQLRVREVDEATSDMFLNWVYYKATNGQEGFLNWSWSGDCRTSSGCSNNEPATLNTGTSNEIAFTYRPGEIRFWWMEQQMGQIFDLNDSVWR